jgi:mRNA interferase HigB
VRIISKRALREFWERHSESEQTLLSWYREVEKADWTTPAHVMERYPNASIVGPDRVVFRIRNNEYRIVVRIFYPGRMLYIRFVGTHREYDRINAEEV